MSNVFVFLQPDKAWKAEMSRLHDTLALTAKQKEDILVKSSQIGARLTAELRGE